MEQQQQQQQLQQQQQQLQQQEMEKVVASLEASLGDWASRYAGLEEANRKLVSQLEDLMGYAEELERKNKRMEVQEVDGQNLQTQLR